MKTAAFFLVLLGVSCVVALDPLKQRPSCSFCELLLWTIDSFLPPNPSVKTITNEVNNVCSHISSEYYDVCDSAINSYGQTIIYLLAQKRTIDEVCVTMGMCNSDELGLLLKPLLSAGPLSQEWNACQICHWITDLLGNVHFENKEDGMASLAKLCYPFNGDQRTTCDSLVAKFGPVWIATPDSTLRRGICFYNDPICKDDSISPISI